MDFSQPGDDESIRQELRDFLAAELPDSMRAGGFEWHFDHDFHVKFIAWQGKHLAGAPDATLRSFTDELYWHNIDLRTGGPTGVVAKTLMVVGTQQQKDEYLAKFLSGEALVALGYTEPDSGSDVAAAQTRAVRDGDDWVINGQKVFTSNAGISQYVFVLARTNTEAPKHKGLTMFLVPLDAPGVEVRPIDTLRGHPTYMTYYADVRVPDSARVGDVDGGWRVMRAALDVEHSAGSEIELEARLGHFGGYEAQLSHTVTRILMWAREARDATGARVIDDLSFRSKLAKIETDLEVARLLVSRNDPGRTEPGVGNGRKLFNSEAYLRATGELLEAMGPVSLLDHTAPGVPASGWAEQAFRDAPVATIAGGSSEVQRDVIAERRLKLPTTRRAASKQ